MLLQALCEYAQQLKLPPTLYAEGPLRYIIQLDGSGRLLSSRPIDTADPSSPRTRRGQRRNLPQIQRASGVKPLLLADKADYTLGLGDDSKAERVMACHAAYIAVVGRCAGATGERAVAAVQRFLAGDPSSALELGDDFDRGAIIGFDVDGTLVTDLPAVQAFWAEINDPDASPGSPAPVMQCLVCGQERPVLQRLQAKIKGVPGGQTSGTSIISANADAFLSYRLEASLIAPTCASCGERFTKALNELLSSASHRVILGGAAFVFWTRKPDAFDFLGPLTSPTPEQVRALYESVRGGGRTPEIDETAFYAAELAGSGGRAAVRDWIDSTVGEAKRHLSTWFGRQRIVGPAGDEPRPLGIYALAGSTVRELRDLSPTVGRGLVRAALTGAPLPLDLIARALRRSRAEQRMTMQRAALIKLVLRSHEPEDTEDEMVQLNRESPSPAYRCGRLLAVLEEAQRAAIPNINATVVDRFYGTASSAPRTVFPRLLNGVRPHLAKLERDRPGAYYALQDRLVEIQGGLTDFPRTLSLRDQGLFALGYYHQLGWDRTQAREAAARRRAGAAADATNDADLPAADVDSVGGPEEEQNG